MSAPTRFYHIPANFERYRMVIEFLGDNWIVGAAAFENLNCTRRLIGRHLGRDIAAAVTWDELMLLAADVDAATVMTSMLADFPNAVVAVPNPPGADLTLVFHDESSDRDPTAIVTVPLRALTRHSGRELSEFLQSSRFQVPVSCNPAAAAAVVSTVVTGGTEAAANTLSQMHPDAVATYLQALQFLRIEFV